MDLILDLWGKRDPVGVRRAPRAGVSAGRRDRRPAHWWSGARVMAGCSATKAP